jgi:hypothetical protein
MHTDEAPQCAVDAPSISPEENSCWPIIRAYRGRKRVISMHGTLAVAIAQLFCFRAKTPLSFTK